MNFTEYSDKKVFEGFWITIEQIVKSNENNENKYKILLDISKFLPCLKCMTHFKIFLLQHKEINIDWFHKLRNSVSLNKLSKTKCKSCNSKKIDQI